MMTPEEFKFSQLFVKTNEKQNQFEYPKLETPVLALYRGEWRILERRTDKPGFEDTYKEYQYWDDPHNDGQGIDDLDITKWQEIPSQQVSADSVVEANRQLLLDRSNVGIQKYGVTLDKAALSEEAILQHALEEALDLANYLQTRLMAIRSAKNDNI